MSSVYSANATNNPTSITIPSDGDTPMKASDVNPAFQGTFDKASLAVTRTTPLASLVALRAITGPTNGLVRFVQGYGTYVFDNTGSFASVEALPYVVAPSDATPGFWISSDAIARFAGEGASRRWVPARNPVGISAPISPSATRDLMDGSLATDVTRYLTGTAFANRDNVSLVGRHMAFDLNPYLVQGCRLYWCQPNIQGFGHAGLPGLMPRYTVLRTAIDPVNTTIENLFSGGFFIDSAGNAAAFDTLRQLGGNLDQNQFIDLNEYSYHVLVVNEGHTNSQAGLLIYGFELSMGPY